MATLRKITAVSLIILSVLGFIACAGIIIGALVARQPIIDGVVSGLTTANQLVAIIHRTAQEVTPIVAEVNARLDRIEAGLASVPETRWEALDAQVKELAAPVGRLATTLETVSQGITALDETLTFANRLPGVNIQPLPPQLVASTTRLDRLSANMTQLNTAVSATTFDGSRVRTAVGAVATETRGLQTSLQEGQLRLANTQTTLQTTRDNAPRLITLGIVGLILFMLLMGGGQVTLFREAWRWFQRL